MNKTPHRLLHDALTAEQYKQVLVNMSRGYNDRDEFFSAELASDALDAAFYWSRTVEDYDYWDAIHDSLLERGL